MSVQRRVRRSRFLWLACALMLLAAVGPLAIATLATVSALTHLGFDMSQLRFNAFYGSGPIDPLAFWAAYVPWGFLAVVAVALESRQPSAVPATVAAVAAFIPAATQAVRFANLGPFVEPVIFLALAAIALARVRPRAVRERLPAKA